MLMYFMHNKPVVWERMKDMLGIMNIGTINLLLSELQGGKIKCALT